MSRASEIEEAARALAEGCRFSMDERFVHAPAKALVDAVDDALALPPDPPGECCRRAVADMVSVTEAAVVAAHGNGYREGAETMREAVRGAAEIMRADPDKPAWDVLREFISRVDALPLPVAKEEL